METKKTWDRPFNDYFLKFVNEANNSVFDNKKANRSLNFDIFDIKHHYDLVYINPPYISDKGSTVDYYAYYHFLEGLVMYDDWEQKIDYKSKHHRLKPIKNPWNSKKEIAKSFDKLFHKFADSKLVVSYRSDGIPTINEVYDLINQYKSNVYVKRYGNYTYALSKNKKSQEVLFIGQ